MTTTVVITNQGPASVLLVTGGEGSVRLDASDSAARILDPGVSITVTELATALTPRASTTEEHAAEMVAAALPQALPDAV